MSIIVPVYNRPHLVERCLNSLKAQTYRPLHVIVVDNASTDDTVNHVKSWKNVNEDDDFSLEILSDIRHGAGYARETGLFYVDTEKVMFFDSDDSMRPYCVSAIMKMWKEHPSVDVVAWPVAFHRGSKTELSHAISGNLLEQHLVHSILRTLGYAVKTEFLRKAGGWKGEFPNWNDLETGSRILLLHPEVKAFKKPMMDVYPQSESITGLSYSSKAGKWEKSLDAIDNTIAASGRADAKRLHNIITYRRAILAAEYAKEGHMELAEALYSKALSEIDKIKRPLIRLAYHWTRYGMRGTFSIIGKFL